MASYIPNYPEIISTLLMQGAIGFTREKNHRIDLESHIRICCSQNPSTWVFFFKSYKLAKLIIHARFLTTSPK